MNRLKDLSGAAAAACCTALATACFAQAYPSKPVRVVVPFPPGGVDVVTRVITNRMADSIGQPLVIENRAGANGIIGSEFVMHAAPDGYTLLVTTSSTLVTSVLLSKQVPFNAVRDFTPVGAMYEAVQTLTVRSGLPVNSVKELIEYAKRNPGKLTYGSSGIGSAFHFMGEAFKQLAGIDMLHVPYKGTGPVAVAIIAGEIDVAFPSYGNLGGNLGKVKVLALTDQHRYARFPDVPTVSETLPGFRRLPGWIALFGPAAMPQSVVSRLSQELLKAMKAPDVVNTLEQNNALDIAGTPDELAANLKTDIDQSAALARTIGLKPE